MAVPVGRDAARLSAVFPSGVECRVAALNDPAALVQAFADAEFVINDDEVHCLQEAAMNEAPESVACLMLRKLAKARLHHRYRMPLDVAALNCIVEYRLGDAKPERRRLVHPRAVRLATDLNVASVLGAGLIGDRGAG